MTGVANPEETLELFTFGVGEQRYAVDVLRVDEVLPPMEVTPWPGVESPVAGSISLRGERVPVVDLRQCLPGTTAPAAAEPRLLVCWLARRRVAFRIDVVGSVLRVATARLQPAPSGPDASAAVVAVSADAGSVHFLLDLKEVLRKSPSTAVEG
jgi:purine-binding chemotaxis protein CheW